MLTKTMNCTRIGRECFSQRSALFSADDNVINEQCMFLQDLTHLLWVPLHIITATSKISVHFV